MVFGLMSLFTTNHKIKHRASPYFSIAAELCVLYCHNRQLIRKFIFYKRDQIFNGYPRQLGTIFHF